MGTVPISLVGFYTWYNRFTSYLRSMFERNRCFGHQHGSFLKNPWLVLGDVCPDVSNQTWFSMSLALLKLISLEKTRKNLWNMLNTQVFKEHLSNVMEVLGRLTSKLHETWHTAYVWYKNSFKNLKTSWITHKHIEPHIRHIGYLVIERLSRPLTFAFICT